jgi:hypothetical protein
VPRFRRIRGGPGEGKGMFSTGDLNPQGSGTASIGVNQIDGKGGFGTSIKPYAHVHMNSGVWHDNSGQSGVLRYNRAAGGFEVSIDGGATFALVASTISIDLDDAYEVGNEINQNQRTLSPTALSDGGMVIGQVPVLIKHATPGAGNTNGSRSLVQGREDAGVIASGFSLTSNLPNTFAYSALGPGFLHLQASGTQSTAPRFFAIGLGNVGSIIEGLGIFSTDAAMQWNARDISIATDAGEADGNVVINTGNTSNGLGGQISLEPFGSSGRLEFRFGPHQAWYEKLTHSSTGGPANDGFWPLPHSGQIAQMIANAGGGAQSLQAAYNGGNEIALQVDNSFRDRGVVIRDKNTSQAGVVAAKTDITLNYSLAASGFTGPNGEFAFHKMMPNGMLIRSSGIAGQPTSVFGLGYQDLAPRIVTVFTDSTIAITGQQDFSVLAGIVSQSGGQVALKAFTGSGEIQYRYGPHQSWAMKVRNIATGGTSSDGFWPIPHSGYIDTMILRAIKTKAITIERPALNQDLTIWYTNEPITIIEVESVVRGTADASGSFAIRYGSSRALSGTELTTTAIQCTSRSTGQITSSFDAPTIPADNWVWIGVSGVSGVPTTQLNVTLQYQ